MRGVCCLQLVEGVLGEACGLHHPSVGCCIKIHSAHEVHPGSSLNPAPWRVYTEVLSRRGVRGVCGGV